MVKNKEKCPICEKGNLIKTKEEHFHQGINLGFYPAEKCSSCGEVFTEGKYMQEIEKKAKEKGIWGLGKRTKVTVSGNSLAIRIPKEIADYLKIKKDKNVYIHPEEKKLVIDVE